MAISTQEAPDFQPTHEFHLTDGSVVLVTAELRGDWVAHEADGTPWYTVCGDMYPEWSCCVPLSDPRHARRLRRVVKYGHRFIIESKTSSRYRCECGETGTWMRSEDRADLLGRHHHRGACRVMVLPES